MMVGIAEAVWRHLIKKSKAAIITVIDGKVEWKSGDPDP